MQAGKLIVAEVKWAQAVQYWAETIRIQVMSDLRKLNAGGQLTVAQVKWAQDVWYWAEIMRASVIH